MKTLHKTLVTALITLPILMTAGCNMQSSSSEAAEHIDRSETYTGQGQYRAAILEVRNALQKDPGNVTHVVRLAEIYNQIDAGSQASEVLEPWSEEAPEAIALPLAEAYLEQSKHLSAGEALSHASPETDAERLKRQWLDAEIARQSGQMDQAIGAFRDILSAHPEHVDATVGLVKALLTNGEQVAALEHLSDWRAEHGNDPDILYLEGLVHYRLNELDPAVERLTEGLTAMPQSDVFLPIRRQTLSLLSRALTEQGNFTDARVYNEILAENTNTDMRQSTEAALEAIGEGDLDTARSTLEDLIQQNPDNELLSMLLGVVNLQQGNLNEGEPLLSENVDAETSPVPFIRMSTMAQIDTGKRDQALKTLERALLARPSDVELLAMHGVLALSLEDKATEGIVSLNKALQVDNDRVRLRLALAQYYVQNDQPEQALGQLRSAFSQQPADWAVTNYYVAQLFNNGHTGEAGEVRDTLIENHEEAPYANVLASMIDFRLGNRTNAEDRLRNQINETPDWATPYMALASIHQNSGNTDAAIDALLNAARLAPGNVNPLQQAGRLYARSHSPEDVVSWLKKVSVENEPLAPSASALAAQIRVQQGNTGDARDLLTGHLDSSNPVVKRVQAMLLAAEGSQAAEQQNWGEARAKVAEAVSMEPENADHQLLLIRIAIAEGAHDEADQMLDEAEDNFGRTASIMLTRSLLLRQTEGEQAAFHYLQSQWRDDQNPNIAPELIRLARQTGADNTLTLAQQWAETQPESGAAWTTLADIQMNAGNEEAAIEHYRSAIERQPNNVAALNNLAWLISDDNPEEALAHASRAAELAPRSAAVLDTHGWILHLNNRNQEAIEVLRQANELAPDSAEISEHLRTAETAL